MRKKLYKNEAQIEQICLRSFAGGIAFELFSFMNFCFRIFRILFQNEIIKNRIVFSTFALFLGFISSSCSEYLKGKPFTTNFIQIKSDGKLACLDNLSSDMQKFLDSSGTNTEIDQTVTCINTTLTELQLRVEGHQEATSFTAAEIYEIFAKFASEANVSKVAAENLVMLKAALLGGDSTKITKKEIDLLKSYLLLVKEEAKNLKPYIKLFYFNSTERAHSKELIKEAFDQLNKSLKNLYKNSQLANSGYSFLNFKDMVVNVLNLTDDKKAMAEIGMRLNGLLNGNLTVLSEADRLSYIDNLTEALRLFSIYKNGYAKFEFRTSTDLNDTFAFIESLLFLCENSLQYKKTQSLSSQTLDGFISAVVNSNFLPFKLSPYTAAMFYRTILVRVFEAGAKGDVKNFTGLKPFHLANIKRELATYRLYCKILERVAGEALFASRGITRAPLREIQLAVAALNGAAETEILSTFDAATQSQILNNFNDLRSEFIGNVPVIFHNRKVGIAINQDTWGQNWQDLARGLYIKMLTRLLMQGWGQIYPLENIQTNYLSELDMTNWYSEFKYFGIEIKMFDPRTFNSGATGFKTGNLFTRSGNGDNKLGFKETFETLGFLMTSSGLLHKEIKDSLFAANCNLAELDVFDNHWNYESCLLQLLQTNYRVYFSSLPHLVSYLNGLNAEQVKNYFTSTLTVVRTDERNAGTKVETSDIQSMNSLMHFVEGLFVSHDLNLNSKLSESEIRTAYPKFLNIATEFAYKASRTQIEEFTSWKGDLLGYSCFTEQDLIKESFVFLIYNGRTPTQDDFNSFPCVRGVPLISFSGEVDRSAMLNTFKALKSVIGN